MAFALSQCRPKWYWQKEAGTGAAVTHLLKAIEKHLIAGNQKCDIQPAAEIMADTNRESYRARGNLKIRRLRRPSAAFCQAAMKPRCLREMLGASISAGGNVWRRIMLLNYLAVLKLRSIAWHFECPRCGRCRVKSRSFCYASKQKLFSSRVGGALK